MEINQNELRQRLSYAVSTIGVKQNYICKYTGISTDHISRFLNGKINLSEEDAQRLQTYFDKFFMIAL